MKDDTIWVPDTDDMYQGGVDNTTLDYKIQHLVFDKKNRVVGTG